VRKPPSTLKAARDIADHMYLQPDTMGFAPHLMLSESDRDKFCVGRIIDFYHRQNTNYLDYFEAAWRASSPWRGRGTSRPSGRGHRESRW
jgi:hypothetical protein